MLVEFQVEVEKSELERQTNTVRCLINNCISSYKNI